MIDILGTIRRFERWRKIALSIAALILIGYAGWYVWLFAR